MEEASSLLLLTNMFIANTLVEKLNADPRLQGVTSGFNPNFPQYLLKVDLAKAAKLGVDLNCWLPLQSSWKSAYRAYSHNTFYSLGRLLLTH